MLENVKEIVAVFGRGGLGTKCSRFNCKKEEKGRKLTGNLLTCIASEECQTARIQRSRVWSIRPQLRICADTGSTLSSRAQRIRECAPCDERIELGCPFR